MFEFEDIADLPNHNLQKIMAQVNRDYLPYALANASDKVKKAILNSLTKRTAENILEEMEYIKREITKERITEARNSIIKVIKEMARSGEVDLVEFEDDYFQKERLSYMDLEEEDGYIDQNKPELENKVNFRFEDIIYLDRKFLVKYLHHIIYYDYNQRKLALALIESTPEFRDYIYSNISINNKNEINELIFFHSKQLIEQDRKEKTAEISDAKKYLVHLIDEIESGDSNTLLDNEWPNNSYYNSDKYNYNTIRKNKEINTVFLSFSLASLFLFSVIHTNFQLGIISLVVSFIFSSGVFVIKSKNRNLTKYH